MTLRILAPLVSFAFAAALWAGEIDPSQLEWFKSYQKQENAPNPAKMFLNTSPEPELTAGFVSLTNGKDLSDWVMKGGKAIFEYQDGVVTGTCIPGEQSSYLSTKREDYRDFIFTCEMRWLEDLNSGVMFRAQSEPGKAVFGPQVEMEGIKNDRGWSGGIYGQSCGGYWYPLWLKEHAKVRNSLNKEGWNRVTVMARGKTVKTWLNGVPAAHWIGDGTYAQGYFGLQVHKAKGGKVQWRGLKVKELTEEVSRLEELDQYWGKVSRAVREGDFEGYRATCHPDAVFVHGLKSATYPMMKTLAKWKPGFVATQTGEAETSVEFRFGERWGDEASALEKGMFRFVNEPKEGDRVEVFIDLEALLIKTEDGWKLLMENQTSYGTKADWEALASQ